MNNCCEMLTAEIVVCLQDDKPPSDVAVLPDTIEDVAEFALEKVLEAGSGVAKTVMNFLRDLEEVCGWLLIALLDRYERV